MSTTVNPRTRAYLASLGLNANAIAADGWDREGYETFDRDGTGRKIIQDNEPVREWHEWPDGFDYDTFAAHWEADLHTRGFWI